MKIEAEKDEKSERERQYNFYSNAFNKFHIDISYQSVAAPEAEINRFVIMQLT